MCQIYLWLDRCTYLSPSDWCCWRALILFPQNASCTCAINVAKKEAAFVNHHDQLVGNSWEKFRYQEFFEDKTTILFLFFGPLNLNPYLMYHFPWRDLCMHSSFSLFFFFLTIDISMRGDCIHHYQNHS